MIFNRINPHVFLSELKSENLGSFYKLNVYFSNQVANLRYGQIELKGYYMIL